MIDPKVNFSNHINTVAAKALTRANLILKCFVPRDCATIYIAFITFIQTIIQYASCVWSLCGITDIRTLESVQRRFTKEPPGQKALQYSEWHEMVDAQSLDVADDSSKSILYPLQSFDSLGYTVAYCNGRYVIQRFYSRVYWRCLELQKANVTKRSDMVVTCSDYFIDVVVGEQRRGERDAEQDNVRPGCN